MRALNASAYLVALLISAGEIARFWGSERFVPMALDELFIAAALVWAAWRARSDGACWHLAAWSAYCGLVLVFSSRPPTIRCMGRQRRRGRFI
jgi:hypothetical protein